MKQASNNKKIKVAYTCKLSDGTILDKADANKPFEFTLGQDTILRHLEKEIEGMRVGEEQTIKLSEKEAFGPYRNELLIQVDRERFPDNINEKVGTQVELKLNKDEKIKAMIKHVTDKIVIVDGNHPLAGMDLIFDIKLLDVA